MFVDTAAGIRRRLTCTGENTTRRVVRATMIDVDASTDVKKRQPRAGKKWKKIIAVHGTATRYINIYRYTHTLAHAHRHTHTRTSNKCIY